MTFTHPNTVERSSRLGLHVLRLPLNSRSRKVQFILVVAIPTAFFTLKAAEITLASIYARSQAIADLRRSAAVDPADPEAYRRLGQAILYRFEGSDETEGLQDLRKAVALGPNRPLDWLDLALACESADDDPCAAAGFAHALELSPMQPRIHWLAANFRLGAGETGDALPELRETLKLSSAYSIPAFELCARTHIDPETVDKLVLPASQDPALKLTYAAFLISQRQIADAARVWDEAVAGRSRFPFVLAEPYVDRLIEQKEYSQAFVAWRELERLGIIGTSVQDGTGSVFNGGFEEDPLNAGFDWHYGQPAYVSLNFADSQAYEGGRCLRLDFLAATNGEFEPLYELVSVRPNQSYTLTAYVRTEQVTSDSGPRLRVADATDPHDLNIASEATVGSTPWHSVQVTFVTGPRTRAVRISLWRPKSRSFPGQISGTVWIDGVSLEPGA